MLPQYTHTSQHSTLPPPPQPCGPASPFRGNHDVNRKQCASYFSECEADETDPVFPWFPKWKQFKEAFDEFYRDFPAITFTPAEPWTVFEIPDVGVVVAGLNSTMDEGHDDAVNGLTDPGHHGLCTESQLRWFEKRFESDDYRGWLRIGAIHHNIERGCLNDNENLRDAEELGNILAGSLDLILHGHMHHAKTAKIKGRPVYSTGSASLLTRGVDANACIVFETSAFRGRDGGGASGQCVPGLEPWNEIERPIAP